MGNVICLYHKNYWKFWKKIGTFLVFWELKLLYYWKKGLKNVETSCAGLGNNYRSYERSCWELEQNKNKFLFWPPCPCIFRIARRYLLHSLMFPHSLRIFKDFGTKITNTALFVKIFIFQKWVLFPIWCTMVRAWSMKQNLGLNQQSLCNSRTYWESYSTLKG